MKILIDGRFWGLENAGLGRYTTNLVKHLARIDSNNKYILLLRKKYFNRINLPRNWDKVLADFGHYTLTEQTRLPLIIIKTKPDISHFPHFNVPVFFRGPFIVTIHDLLMHERSMGDSTLNPFQYLVKKVGYKFVFSHLMRVSKKIIVPSEYVKGRLLESYKTPQQKIEVIYEGAFNFENVTELDVLKKYKIFFPYFIYVGSAYSHKNLIKAIYAMLKLNKTRKKKALFLIISSRNVFSQRLGESINKTGAQDYVKLLDKVSDSELLNLYKNSVAFLFPSTSEGFGLPGIEAMKAGTILTCSDIPVFREVYQDNAIYFDPRDPDSIANALGIALDLAREDRANRIKKASEFVKRYSWSKMAKETLEIYESCLSVRQSK